MINKKIFFKGYKSILAHDSPAIALGRISKFFFNKID